MRRFRLINPQRHVISATILYTESFDTGKYSRPYMLQVKTRFSYQTDNYKNLNSAKREFTMNFSPLEFNKPSKWEEIKDV